MKDDGDGVPDDPDLLTIGDFAHAVGLPTSALRHYDGCGLLVLDALEAPSASVLVERSALVEAVTTARRSVVAVRVGDRVEEAGATPDGVVRGTSQPGTAVCTTALLPAFVRATPAGMLARFQALLHLAQNTAVLVALPGLGWLAAGAGAGAALSVVALLLVACAAVSRPRQAAWPAMFTIQDTPKRSVHMPKTSPHICGSSGTCTEPPSASRSQ